MQFRVAVGQFNFHCFNPPPNRGAAQVFLVMGCTRCTSIWTKLSYQFLDWPKVVPWLVLWKNPFSFKLSQKLWSRRVAQFYSMIYSSKMIILHIFAILGTLQVGLMCKTLKVSRMKSCEKNKPLFERIAGCIWSLE